QFDGVVDDANAAQHGGVWPFLMRRFRVEKGKLAGRDFHGQVRIAKCAVGGAGCGSFSGYDGSTGSGGRSMWLEDHFGNGSMLQRNERGKLAASFWNNIGAGVVIGGMAAAFFLDKPEGTWTKIGIAIAGLALGWLCYSIASNILTYMHTAPEERR